MTSRERLRKILNHEEADRVPIDIGQDHHNGIHENAYKNLLDYLGEKDEIVYYDQMQHLAICKESILQRLHADTRYFFTNASESFKLEFDEEGSYKDEWGNVRKNTGLYHDTAIYPISNCTMQKIANYRLQDPEDPYRFKDIRRIAEKLTNETEYAVIGADVCSLFYLSSELMGFQEYMEKILSDQEMVVKIIDMVLDWMIKFFSKYLDEVGDLVEMVWIADDWGTQRGPIINPRLFREIFIPRYKDFTSLVKSKTKAKIALHSCGSVMWAMDDFIDAGIDVLHPIQGDAEGMLDPAEIKAKYGDRLVFYSNLKNQTTIPNGTPEEVKQDVLLKLKELAPGGGYIMAGGHNIQADVPPENLLTIIDTTVEYGTYPIDID